MSIERGQRYSADVPLRWSDMDAYGHVNNVQFLRLLEDARGGLGLHGPSITDPQRRIWSWRR